MGFSWYRDGTDGDADDFDEDFYDGFGEAEPLWRRGKKPGVQDATDLVNYYLDHSLLPQYFPRHLTLTFFSRGRFNRLFLIDFESANKDAEQESEGGSRMKQEPLPSQLLLRIAMPWDPYYKVESEVATMMLVDRLGIPTPRVFFFDSSARNPLGLECIFMERVGGVRIYELWAYNRRGYDASYISVASQVKDYLSRLWEHSFDLIGNVYYDWDGTRDFFIGPIVCVEILKTTASWIGWSPSCGRPQRRAI